MAAAAAARRPASAPMTSSANRISPTSTNPGKVSVIASIGIFTVLANSENSVINYISVTMSDATRDTSSKDVVVEIQVNIVGSYL